MQFRFLNVEFKPSLLGTLITVISIPLFIKLGYWQYEKAALKQKIQVGFEQTDTTITPDLKNYLTNSESLEFKNIKVEGEYETDFQILVDNKVENSLAGYHVITPLKIRDSNTYVLVNRGWIQGNKIRDNLPVFDTPNGQLNITGMAWLPTKKIFTLEESLPTESKNLQWQPVWQNLDMQKYINTVPIKILPVIIKLAADNESGGFVRNWEMSADRIVKHIGYAYQWFGFAFAALGIYIYLSIKKIN